MRVGFEIHACDAIQVSDACIISVQLSKNVILSCSVARERFCFVVRNPRGALSGNLGGDVRPASGNPYTTGGPSSRYEYITKSQKYKSLYGNATTAIYLSGI